VVTPALTKLGERSRVNEPTTLNGRDYFVGQSSGPAVTVTVTVFVSGSRRRSLSQADSIVQPRTRTVRTMASPPGQVPLTSNRYPRNQPSSRRFTVST